LVPNVGRNVSIWDPEPVQYTLGRYTCVGIFAGSTDDKHGRQNDGGQHSKRQSGAGAYRDNTSPADIDLVP
ncbi:hypothetical protein K0M31_006957, partial [Melipona bicolor]